MARAASAPTSSGCVPAATTQKPRALLQLVSVVSLPPSLLLLARAWNGTASVFRACAQPDGVGAGQGYAD